VLETTGGCAVTAGCDWLPALVRLEDHGGDWEKYINAVFAEFYRDFIESQPKFRGRWVRCRRDPMFDGKEAGFWHCVSEGESEARRVPDLRRCERIRWIRAVIEHATDPSVDHWTNKRGPETRHLIWWDEAFLVVLAERTRQRDGFQYFQLITAYCTPEEQRRDKLRRERDATRNG
jgi:hypothetical protein